MTKYIIVVGEGFDRLQMAVNAKMEEGFEPLGGVTSPAKTRNTTRKRRVAQAMIGEVEEVEEDPTDNASEPATGIDAGTDTGEDSDEDSEYVEGSEEK